MRNCEAERIIGSKCSGECSITVFDVRLHPEECLAEPSLIAEKVSACLSGFAVATN